ncbi:MAG: hypothetical protein K9W43_10305 [Candidatus Thorarchaeota archaeon]|nr:hypothetical protein [Candidatus Thorarchaeota archaeon]
MRLELLNNLGIILSDEYLISGAHVLHQDRAKTARDLLSHLKFDISLQMPCDRIIDEIYSMTSDEPIEHAVFQLSVSMNYYRFFWKYDLPDSERYRSDILAALGSLRLPHAHDLFNVMLISFEEWRTFEAVMFVLQYITHGIIWSLDGGDVSSFSLGSQQAVNLLLGFMVEAAETFSRYTDDREVLGGFALLRDQPWFENLLHLGNPDIRAVRPWCQLISHVIVGNRDAAVSIASQLSTDYPGLAKYITSSVDISLKLPDYIPAISNIIAATVGQPLFKMIGASLV